MVSVDEPLHPRANVIGRRAGVPGKGRMPPSSSKDMISERPLMADDRSFLAPRPPESSLMSTAAAVVFVIDDEASVRDSLGLLIESAGLQPRLFACPEAFFACIRSPAASCL